MPDFNLDADDVAVGTAIGDSNRRRRNRRDPDDMDDDYEDGASPPSNRSLALTILCVVGTLILLVALILTFGQ